jgi:hypothetical protein
VPRLDRINADDVKKLLLSVSPHRAAELSALLDELNPTWLLDRDSDEDVFEARLGQPNKVRMGLKCSKRLQVHAYAVAVTLSSIAKPKPERDRILGPVNEMLNWAVGTDLTRWLNRSGVTLRQGHVLRATDSDIPEHLLLNLSKLDKALGMSFYAYATAWILFHELGHLKLKHTYTQGFASLQQEKEADRFAADWMAAAASESTGQMRQVDRLCALFGSSVALLWLTIFNVYVGRQESKTHPESYDRLFQVLDCMIDPNDEQEYVAVWQSIATMLFIHMDSAGYDFDESDAVRMQGDPRDEVSYLIDRIAHRDHTREPGTGEG